MSVLSQREPFKLRVVTHKVANKMHVLELECYWKSLGTQRFECR